MTKRVIVVGSGQAGFQLAASLRQDGFDGEILIFGTEQGLPYQRPPLSKGYIKDGLSDRLLFRNADFFEKNDIVLEDGVTVTSIDRAAATVTLSDARVIGYDHLVIATGTRNRRLPVPGIDLDNVLGLRTLADAETLRDRLSRASRLAVIGGGFIGLEVAATARAAGLGVTVLEATPRLMSRVVSPPVSDYFLSVHRAAGIHVRLDTLARAIVGDGAGKACGVEAASGEVIPADLVLVSAGVVPNVEIAAVAGLFVQDGIRVDDQMATEDPAISAIGDCVSFPYGQDGTFIRLESVQNAIDQAKCLSRRLVGHPEPYDKLPWFWSDQGPHKLQIAGLTGGADHYETRGGAEAAKLSVQCYRRGELIGVETVNVPADHMAARRILVQTPPLSLDAARTQGFDLPAIMKAGSARA